MHSSFGEKRMGKETHGNPFYLTNITQLHGIATIIQLLVRSLKWKSEIWDVLERLLVVHSFYISDTFDLKWNIKKKRDEDKRLVYNFTELDYVDIYEDSQETAARSNSTVSNYQIEAIYLTENSK